MAIRTDRTKKTGIVALAILMWLQGCVANAPHGVAADEDENVVVEGQKPAPQTPTVLTPAVPESMLTGNPSGSDLYRGIIFGDGPVADQIPTIRKHMRLQDKVTDPKILAETRKQLTALIDAIAKKDPKYFDGFETEVLSGDQQRIAMAIANGTKLAREESSALGFDAQDTQKCIVFFVVVAALVVNAALAANFAYAFTETYFWSSPDDIFAADKTEVEGEEVALMESEAMADIATMQKLSVWEFQGTSYSTLPMYTDKTNHKLVLGDFDGDATLDRFYYAPGGTDDDAVSTVHGDFIADQGRIAEPKVGDFDGDGVDDILFWEPGHTSHYIFFFERSNGTPAYTFIRYSSTNTASIPYVGDFNSDGHKDIFWHGPGSVTDVIWMIKSDRSFTTYSGSSIQVGGTYTASVAGDFAGDTSSDMFWYCPGTCGDTLWVFKASSTISLDKTFSMTVNGSSYKPFVADFDHNTYDDIFWYAPGSGGDSLWEFKHYTGGWAYDGYTYTVNGTYDPVAGFFGNPSVDMTVVWWPDR